MEVSRIFADVLLGLHDELSRRRDDQGAHSAPPHLRTVRREALQDRQDECGGFSGPGLRDSDHIAAAQHGRNGFRLNGSRLGVARLSYGFGDLWPEAEGGKWHVRSYSVRQ